MINKSALPLENTKGNIENSFILLERRPHKQTNRQINAFLGTTAVCFDVYGIDVI